MEFDRTLQFLTLSKYGFYLRHCKRTQETYDEIKEGYAEILRHFDYDYEKESFDKKLLNKFNSCSIYSAMLIAMHELISFLNSPDFFEFNTVEPDGMTAKFLMINFLKLKDRELF